MIGRADDGGALQTTEKLRRERFDDVGLPGGEEAIDRHAEGFVVIEQRAQFFDTLLRIGKVLPVP